LDVSWKTKGNSPAEQFWSPTDLSLFYRWIMLIFGYVVRLDFALLLDGGE
jgi:hypothetical protein